MEIGVPDYGGDERVSGDLCVDAHWSFLRLFPHGVKLVREIKEDFFFPLVII